MFIFTRRAIQNMLSEIAEWMPAEQMSNLVSQLNCPRTNRLPQMWEVVWLYALGGVTQVEHEREFSGKKPDLFFEVDVGGRAISVVADITTLSDIDLHHDNPFEKLTNAVHAQARKFGCDGGGFDVKVEHQTLDSNRGKTVQLLIPTGSDFDNLVKLRIRPFARLVAGDVSSIHKLEVDEPGAKFSIEFKGASQYSQGSHRSYDVALSAQKNVLSNRLNGKKDQLRGAPDGAVRMLVVCDGDCSLLRRVNRSMEGFNARQIAERFLAGTTSVDLVLLVTIDKESQGLLSRDDVLYVSATPVAAPRNRPVHLSMEAIDAITKAFDQAVRRIPVPVMMPNNALRRNLDSEWSHRMGGMQVHYPKIRVSARAVLELLSGQMTYERFAELHRMENLADNVFASRLFAGELIRAAELQSLGCEEDDDWLVLEFGPPDAAVSKFKVPGAGPLADSEPSRSS